MRFFYGENNYLRVLDEVEFWKLQEAEHTTVIKQIVPDLESNYIDQLDNFSQVFLQTQGQGVQLIETIIRSKGMVNQDLYRQILDFIYYAINSSKQFIQFLNEVIRDSKAVQGDNIAIIVINHIIRESQYFIGIAQTILYN
ncbi:MAG: DUF2935 domain-containing protein [Eubacteriales bacterium]